MSATVDVSDSSDSSDSSDEESACCADLNTKLHPLKKQKVDLHNLNYVDDRPCSLELECGICKSPLVAPLWTICDHWFCKKCLLQTFDAVDERRRGSLDNPRIAAKYNCPTCRGELKRNYNWAKAPRAVTNMLAELQVVCPNAMYGCETKLTRGNVQHHVDEVCGYVFRVCKRADCTHWKLRKDVKESCHKETTKVWCPYCREPFQGRAALRKHRDDRAVFCPGAPDCKRRFLTKELLVEHEKDCELIKRTCKASGIGCKFGARRKDLSTHESACPLIDFMPHWQAMQERFQRQDETLRAVQERTAQQEETLVAIQEQKTQLEQEIRGIRTEHEQGIDGIRSDVLGLSRWLHGKLGELFRSRQGYLRQQQRDGVTLTEIELRLLDAPTEPIVIDSDESGDDEQHVDNEIRQEPQSERTEQNITRKRKRTAEAAAEDDAEISAANAARTRSSSNARVTRSAARSRSIGE